MLHLIACISLGIAFASAAVIVIDEIKHSQHMWVMNIVWPVTALYFSVIEVWFYFRAGRKMTRDTLSIASHSATTSVASHNATASMHGCMESTARK